jgi:hypothetical protein
LFARFRSILVRVGVVDLIKTRENFGRHHKSSTSLVRRHHIHAAQNAVNTRRRAPSRAVNDAGKTRSFQH